MALIELVRKGEESNVAEFCICSKCNSILPYYEGVECLTCKKASEKDQSKIDDYNYRIKEKIKKAKIVTDLDCCFSDYGDGFYQSIEDAREAGETGVFGAIFKPFHLDISSLASQIIDGHHEDADEDSLVGLEELEKAVDIFNSLQVNNGSYEMNDKVWQEVSQNYTFAMIKPDATKRGLEDEIMAYITSYGFEIVDSKKRRLEKSEAEWLYQEHKRKEHFNDLVEYTISEEVVLMKLKSENANTPKAFRDLMGPTNKDVAEPHTLRAKYAIGLRENSIHGSDSPISAIDELCYFFDFLE